MLDHIFLTVSDLKRSIPFYEAALAPLGVTERFDYDGKNGPPGHPDLEGFGANGRLFLWLRDGVADSRAGHVGFVASNRDQVDAAYAAAIAAGATDTINYNVHAYANGAQTGTLSITDDAASPPSPQTVGLSGRTPLL